MADRDFRPWQERASALDAHKATEHKLSQVSRLALILMRCRYAIPEERAEQNWQALEPFERRWFMNMAEAAIDFCKSNRT
jgi:hypothetical protein